MFQTLCLPATSAAFPPTLLDVDAAIRHAAQRALQSTGYRDVAKLVCHVKDGVIVLSGRVSSYYLKQVAQEAVLKLKVAYGIENGIEVQRC